MVVKLKRHKMVSDSGFFSLLSKAIFFDSDMNAVDIKINYVE
jgi:hypothetical protein